MKVWLVHILICVHMIKDSQSCTAIRFLPRLMYIDIQQVEARTRNLPW